MSAQGVVCGVVEGLGVHLRFPFRLVTTALCRGASGRQWDARGPQGSRGPLTSRRARGMVRQGTDREGKRRWTPGPGPRRRPGLVGWMPSPSRFVDGVVVDGIWMRKGWMMGTADVDRFSYRFRRSFEDGRHVDARVELSGSRWLYVSTSTAFGRHPSPRCRGSGGHGFGVRPSLMDVTRSCLKREGGPPAYGWPRPFCFPVIFPITRRRYGVMVVDADHADGAFRLALEVDHEHVVIEGVELEVVSVPERAALERVVVPSALLHAPLGRQFADRLPYGSDDGRELFVGVFLP